MQPCSLYPPTDAAAGFAIGGLYHAIGRFHLACFTHQGLAASRFEACNYHAIRGNLRASGGPRCHLDQQFTLLTKPVLL